MGRLWKRGDEIEKKNQSGQWMGVTAVLTLPASGTPQEQTFPVQSCRSGVGDPGGLEVLAARAAAMRAKAMGRSR